MTLHWNVKVNFVIAILKTDICLLTIAAENMVLQLDHNSKFYKFYNFYFVTNFKRILLNVQYKFQGQTTFKLTLI